MRRFPPKRCVQEHVRWQRDGLGKRVNDLLARGQNCIALEVPDQLLALADEVIE
jgi:hypothetical protein